MAIEDIFRALEEQADAECKEVLDNAKVQADAILAEAREEAEAIRRRRLELRGRRRADPVQRVGPPR